MYVENAIDIVIPSFRLDEDTLIKIIKVDQPLNFKINFYIIADNPALAIPDSILRLAANGTINLVINEKNLGFSKTRNKGITLGKSKWVLLLDDDITPERTLLIAYANAIVNNTNAIGFAGVTNFPKPFNSTTLALEINGDTGHCKSAGQYAELMWVPTTNIMLNRESMDPTLFNENLKKGGEDIEFLVRNALLNNKKYVSVADAVVSHPWWPGGTTRRLFRYGAGAAQIASLPAIKKYTYHNFTNTSETLLLLVLCSPFIVINFSWGIWIEMVLILIGVEFIVNCFRCVYLIRKFSLGVAINLFWIKNCYEAGYLTESLLNGRLSGFGERVDMAFTRENPSWFRLNKWKLLKTIFLVIFFTIILL